MFTYETAAGHVDLTRAFLCLIQFPFNKLQIHGVVEVLVFTHGA